MKKEVMVEIEIDDKDPDNCGTGMSSCRFLEYQYVQIHVSNSSGMGHTQARCSLYNIDLCGFRRCCKCLDNEVMVGDK